MTEVLVVDRASFFDGAWPQGFTPMAGAAATRFLADARGRGRYVARPGAEANPAWKQWIPYCVLRCSGVPPTAGPGLFAFRRTRGQTEGRLHGAWSIGLGGHVEPTDESGRCEADPAAFFRRALQRELAEELDLRDLRLPPGDFLGLLNDDATEVGKVHAGLVYRVDLPMAVATANAQVQIAEISKMAGGFASLVEFANLWQNPPQFETWSQILIRAGIAAPIGGNCRSQIGDADG
ncbi:MAG: hypothetical protein WAT39_21895 [Planctomycetota bacterium]